MARLILAPPAVAIGIGTPKLWVSDRLEQEETFKPQAKTPEFWQGCKKLNELTEELPRKAQ